MLEKLIFAQLVKKLSVFYVTIMVICRVQRRPPPVPILCQMNPLHTLIQDFGSTITLCSPRWYLLFKLDSKNSVRISHLPILALYLDLIITII
jgi:hypothetical protein